jgi:hypothetical protein
MAGLTDAPGVVAAAGLTGPPATGLRNGIWARRRPPTALERRSAARRRSNPDGLDSVLGDPALGEAVLDLLEDLLHGLARGRR